MPERHGHGSRSVSIFATSSASGANRNAHSDDDGGGSENVQETGLPCRNYSRQNKYSEQYGDGDNVRQTLKLFLVEPPTNTTVAKQHPLPQSE